MKGRNVKKIKIGIIGVGGVTQFGHIPSFQAIPGVDVTAISDINREKLEFVSKHFGIADTYTEYEQLLKREDIDGVSICTPNHLHAQISIAALKSGKHVLCEKPFAINIKQAESIINEASKSGKVFLENFSQRFDVTTKIINSYISKGKLGHIYYAKCSYLRRKGHPGLRGWFTHKNESGGGALIDIGVHMMDLGLCFMGFPKPVSLTASTYDYFTNHADDGGWPPSATRIGDNFNKKVDTEDLATAFITFDNGSTLLLEAGWAGYSEVGIKISLFGTKAGVELLKTVGGVDEGHPIHFKIVEEVDGHLVESNPVVPETFSYWKNTFPGFIQHFVACIRGEEKPIMELNYLLTVQRIIDLIYLSAQTRKEVKL
jgi:predicted dehydrogenase